MFPFDDLTNCEILETPFEYNGSKGINICIRFGRQEINYEYLLYDEEDFCEKDET